MAEDPHKTWGTININPEPAVQTRMDYDPVTVSLYLTCRTQ